MACLPFQVGDRVLAKRTFNIRLPIGTPGVVLEVRSKGSRHWQGVVAEFVGSDERRYSFLFPRGRVLENIELMPESCQTWGADTMNRV